MENCNNNNYEPKKMRGRKGNRVPRGREDVSTFVDNKIEYYNKYPTDFDTAFANPWFKVVGTDVPWNDILSVNMHGNTKQSLDPSKVPSIMKISYVPGPGICENAKDPANRTFAMIMADLYAKTSGASLGFDNAQLAMQMTSITSIMNRIGEVQRALACVDYWATKNANFPRTLISALGFSYDDIAKNRPIYVSRINSIAHAFNNMEVPSFFDVYKRQYTLASNVYLDEDSEFGQMYVFVQSGHYEYDFENMQCNFVRSGPPYANMGLVIDNIEKALFKWINSSDFYKVNGALLRAYKDAPTITIPDATVSDTISPSKPDHILMQIMNMDIVGLVNNESLNIKQNVVKNVIYWQPCLRLQASSDITTPNRDYMKKKFIRLFMDSPTKDDNCELSRLSNTQGVVDFHYVDHTAGTDATVKAWGITSMQSEIVEEIVIYKPSADFSSAAEVVTIESNILSTNAGVSSGVVDKLAALQPFRYIPPMFYVYGGKNPDGVYTSANINVIGDLYNYTILDEEVLKNQNTVALLSIWRPSYPSL